MPRVGCASAERTRLPGFWARALNPRQALLNVQSYPSTQERANVPNMTGLGDPYRVYHRRKTSFIRPWRPLPTLGANSRIYSIIGQSRLRLNQ